MQGSNWKKFLINFCEAKITFGIIFLLIFISLSIYASDIKEGITCLSGKIIYNEKYSEEVIIKIYDAPVNSQWGYLMQSDHTFQLISIDSVYRTNEEIYISTKMKNEEIRIHKNTDDTWEGELHLKSKKYPSVRKIVLDVKKSVPDWAEQFKHVVYKDGIYEATGTPTSFGHTPYCMVKVEGGRIIDLIYYEKDFTIHDVKDEHYGEEYLDDLGSYAYAGGQLAVEGGRVYKNQMILSQDLDNIDVVSGATFTYYRFKNVVKKALKDAIISER